MDPITGEILNPVQMAETARACADILGEDPSPELAYLIADYFGLDADDVEDMLLDGYDF